MGEVFGAGEAFENAALAVQGHLGREAANGECRNVASHNVRQIFKWYFRTCCSVFQKRKVGPGSYEIKDFLEVADEKPRSIRGIVDTRDKRFSPPFVSLNDTFISLLSPAFCAFSL